MNAGLVVLITLSIGFGCLSWGTTASNHGSSPLDRTCQNGIVPNSDRTKHNPCHGQLGDECDFTCNVGYIAIGRHICQDYDTNGRNVINGSFFGGRCQRLCVSQPSSDSPHADFGRNLSEMSNCTTGMVAIRMNSTDASGPCYATTCMKQREALEHLAHSAYLVWRMARNNRTGIYLDHVDLRQAPSKQDWHQGGVGMTGLGLVSECIAAEMGWQPLLEAQQRINQTLAALTDNIPGFRLARNSRGWAPTFVDSSTGDSMQPLNQTQYSTLATGLNAAGALFAATYMNRTAPTSTLTAEIVSLAQTLYGAVEWTSLLCGEDGSLNPNATGIPMLLDDADGCSATSFPQADGYYQFFEIHYTLWMAFHQACPGQPAAHCNHVPIARMWSAWQGRRLHPNQQYSGLPLLSTWSSYVVQLPFYLVHPFNSDDTYRRLFLSHLAADKLYYLSDAYYAGHDGQYGLGAGPTIPWCAGTTYEADRIQPTVPGSAHCRQYSPYGLVGYMPANSTAIVRDTLSLLASGDTLLPVFCQGKQERRAGDPPTGPFVLWRKSLLDLDWSQGYGITMVDFSSELFGLAAFLIGTDFFINNTNHWPQDIYS